ncbi:MAG: hypothetical protein JXB07_08130 [Anaerolineae bacterium]|nr:hypothetical protein [Anaerolineae bacterium]
MLLWMSGYARSGYLHRLVEAYLRAADDFQADRIFTELDPGAFLLSAVSDIPLTLTYSHILTHGNGTWAERLMQRVTTMVLRTYNVHTSSLNDLYFDKMRLKIIPSIPELDDTDPVSPDVQYVGHLIGSIQSAPFGRLQLEDRQRCVFVYVGTGSISLNVLNNVLPQVFPSKSKWRCFVGAQSVTTSYRLGSVEFHPYVPTDILLPQCDWVICHGGQNTIIQSLLHGVPLIIFPGSIFERRYNAAKIEQSGAGIMGEVNRFTVGWLHAALERQRDCASRSDALGKAIRSHGGPFAAVEAIANWNGCHHEQSSRC